MRPKTSWPTFTRCAERNGRGGWGGLTSAGSALLAAAALLSLTASAVTQPAEAPQHLPVAPASAAPADDGQWTMPTKNYAATRYSTLDQINTGNVKNLRVEFTFSTGTLHGEEAAPIIANNTMYIVTPWPNYVYALDLTKPGAPLKWQYLAPKVAAAQGVACCDTVNRGGVFLDNKFYFVTLDGRAIALDANTGKPVWITPLADIDKGESVTGAPFLVKGKMIVGVSGGEFGVRGWIKALDVNTGKVAWTAYNTGPDKDVLIGPDFHPFYASDRGKDLGVTTWPPDAWKIGGGSSWGWMSYDPDLNLLYAEAANPGPWNQEQRPGDNKWTDGIFARDPDTGAAKWYYQYNPHDEHDYDGINETILLNLPINGRMRKVLMHPDRNGYLYMIDRTTGEVIYARPYGYTNAIEYVDLKTGRPIVNPDKNTKLGTIVHDICPTASGAKDWEPSSYSPRTGYMYIPHENLCMDWENVQANYIAGTPYVGANVVMKPGPGGFRGELTAWDVEAGKPAWQIPEDLPVWSGTVVTAGDLVFYGTMDGWFKAVDAKSGALKWQFKTGSGIIGQPVAYKGPDGREYIAVLSGVGGWSGAIVPGHLNARDPTGALGFVGAVADLPQRTAAGGMLYVFALPPS